MADLSGHSGVCVLRGRRREFGGADGSDVTLEVGALLREAGGAASVEEGQRARVARGAWRRGALEEAVVGVVPLVA